jgi:hypothetical protein
VGSSIFCKRLFSFWAGSFDLIHLEALGAVGTVEKAVIFHGFRSPSFVWPFHSGSGSWLVNRQPIFRADGKAVRRGSPIPDRHGPIFRDVA